jgi:hypothetical protein
MESKTMSRVGWVVGALPALVLLFSASMKFSGSRELVEGFNHLGWPVSLAAPLGILEATVALLYLFPRTAVLGAILVTGYMGGAMAAHVRIGEPFFMQFLMGVLIWGGLYLREPRLGALIPLRREQA